MPTSIAEYWVRPMQALTDALPSPYGTQLTDRLARVRADYLARYPTREPQDATARARVMEFAARVEDEIAAVIRTRSRLYWLHAVRGFRPSIPTTDPIVVFQIRESVESAILKYGRTDPCGGIGWSNEVTPQHIFGGLFAATADQETIAAVSRARMPVLLDFAREQLDELDFLHQAGEHLQRCNIVLRTLLWSGRLVVNPFAAFDLAVSPDLVPLSDATAMALGPYRKRSVAADPESAHPGSGVRLANYTVVPRRPDPDPGFARAPLYWWHPVSLLDIYLRHRSVEQEFRDRNGCELAAVLSVIACLSERATSQWGDAARQIAHWHHALDVVAPSRLTEELRQARPRVAGMSFNGIAVSDDAFAAAIDHLTLTEARRTGIDPLLGVPHMPLVPSGSDLLIDYAWLLRVVDGVFFRVRLGHPRFWS
jgi:hypothetical protein